MTGWNTLDTLDVKGKTVLVRADLNVPMDGDKVTDSTRIDRFAPTAKELAAKGAKVVILSHFGRPKDGPAPEFSQNKLVEPLAKALGAPVAFATDCIGKTATDAIAALPFGGVLLLENVRFHKGEEKNDPAFAKSLAALGDVYVNDAFSAAHRAHASTATLAELLPAAAGRLMQAELEALSKALANPQRPLLAVVGGAKVSTKLELLGNLISKVDKLVIGGAMANTFLLAQGKPVGRSLAEADLVATAKEIMAKATASKCQLLLPEDVVVAGEFKAGTFSRVVSVDTIPPDMMALDIGPLSIARYIKELAECKTVVWNGPLGAFEISPFDAATKALAQEVARLTQAGKVLSVAGGGDTVAALEAAGVANKFSYVSSAGGAFLEWLEGKELPGVTALLRAASPSLRAARA
jgi:phosphoglycerate kinase